MDARRRGSMTGFPLWTGGEPLPVGQVRLLEASAGTGKTWQIAHLVARLVAEYGVPIERVLVITFTTAATAELRDRVRRRLVAARDALAGPRPDAASDPLLADLWDAAERPLYAARLAVAVAAFDLAPISTIHGFAQQMLAQLAFASGQEARLELLADLEPVLDEWVADTLARTYAAATDTRTLTVVEDLGFTPAALRHLTVKMTGPVAPVLDPDELAGPVDVVAAASHWLHAVDAVRTWLASAAGREALEALQTEMARPAATEAARRKVPARRFGRDLDAKVASVWFDKLQGWLAAGATWREGPARNESWFAAFGLARARAAWDGSSPFASFGGYPLFAQIDALVSQQAAHWPRATVAFARGARVYVEAALQRRGLLTYDAMLSRLAERVAEQGPGGALACAIRARFDVALVDEFQDTDSAQWQVLDAVFRHPERRLLLIGDPKQAIYAFRGADVHVYLRAARAGSGAAVPLRSTMTTNWRSDAAYLTALNALWGAGPRPFDHDDIEYIQVGPARAQPATRVHGPSSVPGGQRLPFEVRWFDGTTLGDEDALVTQKELGESIAARLCAREVVALLGSAVLDVARESDAALGIGAGNAAALPLRPVQPHDVAILVRTNAQAGLVRRQLARCGVPAVAAGKDSVFASASAAWLATWLDVVAAPGHERLARSLAITPLFGWSLVDLAAALDASDGGASLAVAGRHERDWMQWRAAIAAWSAAWARQGFMRVLQGAFDECGVIERIVSGPGGERAATDLRHVIELCHAEAQRKRAGPAELAHWLAGQVAAAHADRDDTRAQRLETDAHAVQIVTVHKSKGLEYPIVLLPFEWQGQQGPVDNGQPLAWHDAAGTARLDVRPKGASGRDTSLAAARIEWRQERRRLLYVALTRAAHHCVVWLGPVGSTAYTPDDQSLCWLLLRDRSVGADANPAPIPPFANTAGAAKAEVIERHRTQNLAACVAWQARLEQLATATSGGVGFHVENRVGAHVPQRREPPAPAEPDAGRPPGLAAAAWPDGRSLASAWRVASYTSLAGRRMASTDEPHRGDLSGTPVPGNSPDAEEEGDAGSAARSPPLAWQEPSPLAELAGGRDVGSWVHGVLEELDFRSGAAKDGRSAAALVADRGAVHGVRDAEQQALLVRHLPALLATPLDGGATRLPPGWALRDLPRTNRLDELGFDLGLAAGCAWRLGGTTVDDGAVRAALALRRPSAPRPSAAVRDDAWGGASWLASAILDAELFPRISGVLTGFMDLVFRVDRRYFLADYKTNRIRSRTSGGSDSGGTDAAGHYAQAWLALEMGRHAYHLQALLYTVALHRFLRQRLPGYSYERDVGGHLYLFVRGMTGAAAPRDGGFSLGVYHDCWPVEVVTALDTALAGLP
ncbi:MAG: hypothetical protein EXR79_13325 [Myxococcales bacterium]|nr:hypothetical protein [Myxococcales bacterium]